MKPHDTFLELAAIAMDFPLASAERGRLEQHLAGCAACGRTAHALRGDAMALSNLPPVTLPERRGAEILAVALHPHAVRNPVRLLVVAALLGLLLLGSLAAGAELLRRMDQDDLGIVLPVPSVSPTPQASPGPTGLTDPSGTLAVTRGEGDARTIETLTPDGKTTNLAAGWDPAWLSSDTIIYTCLNQWGQPDQVGQPGICAVNLRAPATPQTLIVEAYGPVPAPDGRSVAIHRGMIDVGETWIMSADGSNPRLLRSGWFPQWSPDGAWLAGQPETPGNAEVAIVGADGEGFRVLAPGYDPVWSPSGDRITYAVAEDSGASIRNVYLDNGEVEILVEAPAGSELSAPAWLPDGRLLYVQDGDIWMFDPGQSRPIRVTNGQSIHRGSNEDPLAIAPSGDWVAYTNDVGAGAVVELASVDGSTGISFPWTGPVTQPVWAPKTTPSPDGPIPSPSPLGSNWTEATMPVAVGAPSGQVESVIAGGIGFLAVGRGCLSNGETPACEGIVLRSADGTAWERVPTSDALDTGALFPMSGPQIGMYDVVAGGPGFVAIGYTARPTMEATVWYSPDTLTWERIPLGDVATTRVNAVGWDGQQFVIVGEDRSDWDGTLKDMATATARAAVWTSKDGRSWTRIPHSPIFDVGDFSDTMEDPSTGGMSDLVPGPGGLVVVGSDCTSQGGCRPAAWTTGGSDTWARVADMEALSGRLRSIASSDSGYMAVGVGEAAVMQSSDGQTWKAQQAPASDLETVTRIGERFFATASSGSETVWATTEGSWAPIEPEDGPLTDVGAQGAQWRFAADDLTAVLFGVTEAGDAAAWVSNPQPAP